MTRSNLCLAGGLLLSSAAIGWLLNENQALRELAVARDGASETAQAAGTTGSGRPTSLPKRDKPPAPPQWRPTTPVAKSPTAKPNPGHETQKTGAGPDGTIVVSAPESAGSLGNPAANQDVSESKVHILAPAGTPPSEDPDNLSVLKNGGFDKELSPWTCENGKIAADPDDPRNPVLEAMLDEGNLRLNQSFEWPAGKKHLVLSLRVKSPAGTESPVKGLHIHLSDKDGKALLATGVSVEVSDEWVTVTGALRPDPQSGPRVPTSITIKTGKGGGTLWIDDVTLK